MAASEQLKKLVAELPAADGRGMYTAGMDKAKIEKTIAAIHGGGPANVEGLVDLLGEAGSEENVKPHYALHCLANHALQVKDEKARRGLCETLAKQLTSNRSQSIKAYLCQELGWAGREEALAPLGALLTDDSLCVPAAMALVGIRKGAAEQFRLAWPKAKGSARRHIMDGLAELAEAKSLSVLTEGLKDDDREVRIAAAAGLANIGDPTAVELLVAADKAPVGWERTQMASNHLKLAEHLAASGKQSDATRVYKHLQKSRTDATEKYLRDAAERGLKALA